MSDNQPSITAIAEILYIGGQLIQSGLIKHTHKCAQGMWTLLAKCAFSSPPPSLPWLPPVNAQHPIVCLLIRCWCSNYIIITRYLGSYKPPWWWWGVVREDTLILCLPNVKRHLAVFIHIQPCRFHNVFGSDKCWPTPGVKGMGGRWPSPQKGFFLQNGNWGHVLRVCTFLH